MLLVKHTRHAEMGIERDGPNLSKKKVLPGIEPGLPEDTDFEIRIRSDNRYLEWLLAGASEKCEVGKRTLQNRYRIEI